MCPLVCCRMTLSGIAVTSFVISTLAEWRRTQLARATETPDHQPHEGLLWTQPAAAPQRLLTQCAHRLHQGSRICLIFVACCLDLSDKAGTVSAWSDQPPAVMSEPHFSPVIVWPTPRSATTT